MAQGDRLLARERALATLSHEMRTPLNGVLGMAGLLAATPLDETQAAYLRALRDSGEHLLSLLNDILDYAKLDSGRIELEPAPVDPERLLQGVCELLSPRAHAGGIEIAWAVDPDLPWLMADDGRLRQILFNLAGNAVKMTARGGVLVTAERADDRTDGRVGVSFRVRDTGPGVPPDAAERIFEEFAQTDAGAQAGGAGLGLAIARRLADAFDGRLWLESPVDSTAEPEGALFGFDAAFQPADQPRAARALAGLRVAVRSASLIVREAASRQVEACGGRAVLDPGGSAEAVRGCVAVLWDPAEGGGPVTTIPRGGPPTLVLLAPEARALIEPYRRAGCAGYLIKPLRRASLAERVLAVAGRRAPARPRPPPLDDERARAATAPGLRVLLAEDNPVNALLARALLTHEGCEVERVADGEEAVAALTAEAGGRFDLVLMDMRMPKLDGPAAARAVRARGVATPIVALTANAFEEDRRACLEAGMDDFLSKPLDPALLRAALARWTGGDREPACPERVAALT